MNNNLVEHIGEQSFDVSICSPSFRPRYAQ